MVGNELHVWAPISVLPRNYDPDRALWGFLQSFPEWLVSFHTTEEPPDFEGTYVAHNAEAFDSLAWDRFVGEKEWYDTMPACTACGLPAGLDAASKALGGSGKDEKGKKAMILLTRAKVAKSGDVVYPVGTQSLWDMVLEYNARDVVELKRVYEGTRLYDPERLLQAHVAINKRGIPIDRKFARLLKLLWAKLGKEASDRIREVTSGVISEDDMYSATKVKNWLKEEGFDVKTLERKQVDAMLADPEGFFGDTDDPRVARVIAVIHERQQSVRATPGKVDRVFVAADADDRVRGCYRQNGAFTGRYTARDLQPHNFPRGLAKLDVDELLSAYRKGVLDLQKVRDEAERVKGSVGDALGTLMRPVIRAPKGRRLVVGDFAQVEARCVGVISGDRELLGAFADESRDVYREMASRVFSVPVEEVDSVQRFVGKTIVLGCGYQMGASKFELSASLGGCDLRSAGTTGLQCVGAYRAGYLLVPEAWRSLLLAFKAVCDGSTPDCRTNRVAFVRSGDDLEMYLPSGRPVVYRGVRMEMVAPIWGGEPRPTPTYRDPRGFRKSVYGGLLMDHVCQGTCGDVLKHCIVALEERGLAVVMHVHDECVTEVQEDVAEAALAVQLEVMSTPPPWLSDFPLKCEGFVTEHYVKAPLKGFPRGKGVLGKVVIE